MIGISLDYFVVSETKLDSSFPSAQFHINRYEVRARIEREICKERFYMQTIEKVRTKI